MNLSNPYSMVWPPRGDDEGWQLAANDRSQVVVATEAQLKLADGSANVLSERDGSVRPGWIRASSTLRGTQDASAALHR